MKKYEQIDISGDAGLRIWGADPGVLFENAAEGLFYLITDTSGIKVTEKRDILLSSDTAEHLLVQWLNELVFLFDTYGFIGTGFSIRLENSPEHASAEGGKSDNIKLEAHISGGTFNSETNESRLLIKAATYHNLSLEKKGSLWEATVIFDI